MIPSPGYIDTHAHLDWFLENGNLRQVLESSIERNVNAWIVPGVSVKWWERIQSACRFSDKAFPAFGVHPLHSDEWNADAASYLQTLIPESFGIAEIGLDYTSSTPERSVQKKAFIEQMELAAGYGKPVIIHCRKGFADLLDVLESFRSRVRGVIHAFSGSFEVASRCVRLGYMIGVAGSITYSTARRLPETVRRLSLEDLLLETDSPDITPEQHRGEINTPANLPLIADRVSEIKSVSTDDVMRAAAANAVNLFGLKG